MRGKWAKGGRGHGGERLSTFSFFFSDALLPAGPCSLTHWLEEGGIQKNLERGKEGEKAKAACEVARLVVEELKWEEYLPLADREQLDTQGGARTHWNQKQKWTFSHTNTHKHAHT